MPDRAALERFVDDNEPNVIAMPIVDAAWAEKVIIQIQQWFPDYSFDIFGLPTWKSVATLKKPEAYPNTSISFTAPFYYDVTNPVVSGLSYRYRAQFGQGKPNELVYRGYESLFYYVNMLVKYGTIFNKNQTDLVGALFTPYQIKTQWEPKDKLLYQANEHTYLYRYHAGNMTVQQ
jgi:hypothetical protein